MLVWNGPRGGQIGVGFDDGHFGSEQMEAEIDFARRAYPDLPDEVPPGTIFAFGKEGTGHLKARFRVGTTVYSSGGQRDLRRLWETVDLIYRLLHPERHKIAS
jgi:hypothetical protein